MIKTNQEIFWVLVLKSDRKPMTHFYINFFGFRVIDHKATAKERKEVEEYNERIDRERCSEAYSRLNETIRSKGFVMDQEINIEHKETEIHLSCRCSPKPDLSDKVYQGMALKIQNIEGG